MPNNYFQFKQFKVDQEAAAMKVCTDSCIFGAWINEPKAEKILDIGTGTGLLALMIAQTHNAHIDAVEIDYHTFLQAKENFNNSPWKNKFTVYHADIKSYSKKKKALYDVIICNPPFFNNHLQSVDDRKNQVLHDNSLSLKDLIDCVKKMLSPDGIFFVMLPPWQSAQLEKLAKNVSLFPKIKFFVKEKTDKEIIRNLTSYSNKEILSGEKQLIIRNQNNSYTDDFKKLLKDYYLHL